MQHMEVTVDEPRHKGATAPIDEACTLALPFHNSKFIANKGDMFSPDCDRLCRGMSSICSEGVHIGDDRIRKGANRNLRVVIWDVIF